MERLKNPPSFDGLSFAEPTHTYRLDGVEVPSVTKIIEPISRSVYGGIDDALLQKAANRGTSVHSAIELWLTYGVEDIPSEHMPYFSAFRSWYDSVNPEIIGMEIRLLHRLMRYAGTCDLLCYIGDQLTLVDYKTTSSVNTRLCAVQLEAYAQALLSVGVKVDRKVILHLSKTGRWREHEFAAKDPQSWIVFGSCKTIYDYNQQK